MASDSPAVDADPLGPEAPAGKARWTCGTLVYTRVGLTSLFFWLLWGDFAWSIRDRSVYAVLQLLLKKFETSDTVAALLIGTLPAAIGLVLGPIISFRSDRHRGPRGRRIPYLLFSAPVAAVSIIGLGFSPVLGAVLHQALGTSSPGYFPSVIVVIAFWWMIFDFAITITNSVFFALIKDVVPEPVLGRFFGLFRAISLIVGIAFSYWLLGHAEKYYAWIFTGVGLIYGIGVVSMCLMVKEGDYPPPPPSAGGGFMGFVRAAAIYFRECFSKPFYLWFFLAFNLVYLCSGPINLFSVFFAKSIDMSMATYGKYLALTYVISLTLTYFIGSLADRFHPLRIGMVAVALYCVSCVWGGFFATTSATYGIALLAHGVLSGCFLTGIASLAQRLLPHSTFAQFFSANGIIGALLNIVMPPIVGGLLDVSGHNYRITFFASAFLSLAALICLAIVYGYWKRLGGAQNYVAP